MRRCSVGESQATYSRFISLQPADARAGIARRAWDNFSSSGRSAAVAYLLWEQMVAGSIPAAPTSLIRHFAFRSCSCGRHAFRLDGRPHEKGLSVADKPASPFGQRISSVRTGVRNAEGIAARIEFASRPSG